MSKGWLDRRMSLRSLYIFSGIAAVFYFLALAATRVYDIDMYFLVESGRAILEQGILRENIWCIDSGCRVVIQQWLYDVILFGVGKAGYAGYFLFLSCQVLCFSFLLWHFFGRRHISCGMRLFFICVILMLCQPYIFSLRPELVTLILIMLECSVLDSYLDGHTAVLWFLPLLMLAEINLHGTMWLLHYAVLLAYSVPVFYSRAYAGHVLRVKSFRFILPVMAMTVCLFVNPYGTDMIMYVFRSLQSGVFKHIYVTEMCQPEVLSVYTLSVFLALTAMLACYKCDVLHPVTFNICVGFSFAAMLYVRNHAFTAIALAFVLRDFAKWFEDRMMGSSWQKDVRNYLGVILVTMDVILGLIFVYDLMSFGSITLREYSSDLAAMDDYMSVDKDDAKVFAGFNSGAFFEYCGYHNVYMDARPELYMKSMNGKRDIAAEYGKYCDFGVSHARMGDIVSREEMNAWFDSYGFDYVVVGAYTETYLMGYMDSRSDYRRVDSVCSDMNLLYEKVR